MKRFNFNVGLATGAACGIILSLFKFKNGRRLGQSIQDQGQATKKDATNLAQAISNLKNARQELNDTLPASKRAISALQNDFEYYQMSISRLIDELQKQAEQLVIDNKTNSKKD
ncbi:MULTISPECIES: hypothetical protein [unclassified Lactobacillus]|jgi:gas vesicle protein|uniref:hypothetical protein n=1 Tax=unclassified Lactobacillus TaxID=2620435 RepID=UPI000EFC671B|nr:MULTISPECIES: hypothetical protein [unclassified Lactobacillus]RMC24224.1 hypothetical protein F5ESL0247_05690 [Lactobacillus sp. ESL0247]RMC28797.1 hypothetical protein F5ESL0246_05690 [Lactobacillus sp. ESL0246]RMC31454.1 hypothetical protein F5ESL0245_05695 [Lactobacillus sp. ESL0245]RMC49120.1 hypothetical protein F5ESL0228_05915 [Lactobacillus sp. ESL0228]